MFMLALVITGRGQEGRNIKRRIERTEGEW
jgi:hypothetical protein